MAAGPVRIGEVLKLDDKLELDLRRRQLRRSGVALKLERIPIDVLLLLVERRGDLVTRQEIVERVWGSGVFLDTDNSINGAIRKIRQALRDNPEHPRFVQTVTGKGYRFIGPVIEPEIAQELTLVQPTTATTGPSDGVAAPAKKARWPWMVGVAAALLITAGLLSWWLSRERPHSAPSQGKVMLAVMPFENLTGDAKQDYLSDGLTEEMITQLGRVDPQHLGVIARSSVMHYRGGAKPLNQISRELGVQYVLEGSVRREADKVRISAQLIQMKDRSTVWARDYDRKVDDLLELEDEIALETSDEIQLALGGQRKVRSAQSGSRPNSYAAYDLYLKGRYFWNKRSPEGLREAVDCFQQAIGKDPQYARAYAGLADSYAMIGVYGFGSPVESMTKAKAAALKALQIDDSLAEAHASLGVIAQNTWDWETAEKEYRRAIELDPNYATAHHWYAEYLALRGRFNEAMPEIERARQLDPLSPIVATDRGAFLYFSRQYDRAIEQFNSVLDMEPDLSRAYMVVYAYAQKGDYSEAAKEIERWRRSGDSEWIPAQTAYVCGRSGQVACAQRALDQLMRMRRREHISSLPLVIANIGVGNKEQAIAWLKQAYAEHSGGLTALKVDPVYDPLRGDPRFQEIVKRVGLSQ